MKVSLIGGVPPLLAGGGLEVQINETARALSNRNVDVLDAWGPVGGYPDVLHFFGADPSSWNILRNSVASHVPLVLSPVLVLKQSRTHIVERLQSHIRLLGANTASMRADLVRRADHLVALHDAEKDFIVRAYSAEPNKISVIGNGSSAVSNMHAAETKITVVGTVGPRKNQLELVRSWGRGLPMLMLLGPLLGGWAQADEFRHEVATRPNVKWTGARPQHEVWNTQASSLATLSASEVEGESLALIDSLRLGRRVIVRNGPHADSLVQKYGDDVLIYRSFNELSLLLADTEVDKLGSATARPPSWDTVASQLLGIYTGLANGSM